MIRGKYKDGIIISKNLYTSDVNSGRDDNVLVIGGAGAGKEYSYWVLGSNGDEGLTK